MSINGNLTPAEIFEQRQETRKLVGFAITLDPEEVVRETEQGNDFGHIVTLQTEYVTDAFKRSRGWHEHARAKALLANGIGDARLIMRHMIEIHPAGTPLDRYLAIGRHESTIASIALAAAQTDRQLNLIIDDEPDRYFQLSADNEALIITAHLEPDARNGCPETGPLGRVEPSPLFKSFVPWATEVAARSLLFSDSNQPA
jgi:hypothetical protein